MPRALLTLAFLAAAWPLAASAVTGAPCPTGPPLAAVQNDAGSGRDAGLAEAAVPVPRDGYFWGTLDPPLQAGLQDQFDGFAAAIPEGPREVSVEVKSLGKLLDPESSWPFVYWLEVFRGEASVAFRGSWEDPITFGSPGGEALRLEVYIVPLVWEELCGPAGPGPGVGALPAEPQLYRVLFACQPACAA